MAPYYQKNKTEAEQCGDIVEIAKGKKESFSRPVRKSGYDREIFFSFSPKELKRRLSKKDIQELSSHNIGLTQLNDFYIAVVDFRLTAFNIVDWYIVLSLFEVREKVTATAFWPIRGILKKNKPSIVDNPFKGKVAHVRSGNNICSQELNYLKARRPKVKRALELFLDKRLSDNQVPTIAVVASGGGIRAMLTTFGFLVGLSKIGLLDAVTYVAALSGSSWAVAPWISSGWLIEDIKAALIPELPYGLKSIRPVDVQLMTNALLVKWAFEQPITLVDFYGLLLANSLLRGFGGSRHRIYLSDQATTIQDGSLPFPIYTAVRADEGAEQTWYEFTPYEIGGAWLRQYVLTWAFGRKFVAGISIDDAPEQSLGFLMGIFGSAFAATFNKIYEEMVDSIPTDVVKRIIQRILKEVGEKRITAGRVFNFTYGQPQGKIKSQKYMDMADAGVDFNLPYPPLSGERPGRKADIIIFVDASKEPVGKADALMGAGDYARKRKLPFPQIVYKGVRERAISIFKDERNPQSPIVIYMPLVKDEEVIGQYLSKEEFADLEQYVIPFDLESCWKSTCDTFNFAYSQEQADQLSALAEFNVRASKDSIGEAIDWFVQSRPIRIARRRRRNAK